MSLSPDEMKTLLEKRLQKLLDEEILDLLTDTTWEYFPDAVEGTDVDGMILPDGSVINVEYKITLEKPNPT